jgi:hypothetical protein
MRRVYGFGGFRLKGVKDTDAEKMPEEELREKSSAQCSEAGKEGGKKGSEWVRINPPIHPSTPPPTKIMFFSDSKSAENDSFVVASVATSY